MLWGTPQVWWVSEARVPPHQYHWPVMMHMAFAFCATKTIKDTRIVTSLVFSSSGRQKSVVCVLMIDVWKYGISASPCPCFVEDKHVWSITECNTEEISKILILKFLQFMQLEMPLSTDCVHCKDLGWIFWMKMLYSHFAFSSVECELMGAPLLLRANRSRCTQFDSRGLIYKMLRRNHPKFVLRSFRKSA